MLPETLKLEVKAPRAPLYQLSARDIAGITPDGFLAALTVDRLLRGPRWIVVPCAQLTVGSSKASDLADSEVLDSVGQMLNQGWSDWILDDESIEKLLAEGTAGVRGRIEWCRAQHSPRRNATSGVLRETKLLTALTAFRKRIDEIAVGGTGAQQEGGIHQVLLEDVIEMNGYSIVRNPIGVPDIQAQRKSVA